MEFIQENWHYIIAGVAAFIALIVWIAKIGIWVGSTNKSIKFLEKGLNEVREDVHKVQEDIRKIFSRLPQPKTSEPTSPLHLTDVGQEISKHVNAKKWAKENAGKLLDQAKDKEEFEVFAICSKYVEKVLHSDEEFKRNIQAVAYDYGYVSDWEQILMVYRIELRDQILTAFDN